MDALIPFALTALFLSAATLPWAILWRLAGIDRQLQSLEQEVAALRISFEDDPDDDPDEEDEAEPSNVIAIGRAA